MEKPDLLKPALISGIIFGVASAIPIVGMLNCFCCALVFACGILAAFLLIKESPVPILYGSGALVGLLAGVFGAFSSTIVSTLIELSFGRTFKEMALRILENVSASVPPEVMQIVQTELQKEFTVSDMILGLFLWLVIFGVFSTLGGILGVALFRKKGKRGEATPPDVTPQ